MRLRPHLAVLGLTASLVVAAGVSASTAGAAGVSLAQGTISATYRAAPAIPQALAVAARHRDYFFTGGSADAVGALTGDRASFAPTAPAAGNASIQVTDSTDIVDGPLSQVVFEGPLSATLAGPLTFTWWWATEDPLAAGADTATLSVLADPGTPFEKEIVRQDIEIGELGPLPSELTHAVYVEGLVRKTLRVVVTPRYIDASHDLRVYYDSADFPSRFALPLGVTPRRETPGNTPLRNARPLRTTTTYIGHDSSEPTIGITKTGAAFVTAAGFDVDAVATSLSRTRIYGSFDGNRTWKDVSPPKAAGSPLDQHPTTLDPYLYVDPTTGRLFDDDLTAACSLLSYSDDLGATWSRGNPAACESPVDDHQTIVAGPPPQGRATNGYPNVIYYCVNKVAGSACAASLDGGDTFLPSGAPAFTGVDPANSGAEVCGGLHGHIVTDRAGRLYLPKGHCGMPWLAVSEDMGVSWRRTLVSPDVTAADIQTAVAVDAAGNLFYTWWDAVEHLPYLAVSRDAGKSFSKPVMIAPPGVKEVNLTSISADKKGRVAISFVGTTFATAGSAFRPWSYYILTTSNALEARPLFRSTTAQNPKNPIHRGTCQGRCGGMFDFLDVKIAPNGDVWAAAVDNCIDKCVTAKGPKLKPNEQPDGASGVVSRVPAGLAWPRP